MDKLKWMVKRMADALIESAHRTGTPTCPKALAVECLQLGVDPVAAERAARIRCALMYSNA